jgi:periplasmic protein TonB
MFETSVIQARAQVAGGRYSLLTISLIAHSAVILGVIAFSIASVEFPVAAPDAYEKAPVFMPLIVPPPLGRPDAPQQAQAQRQAAPVPVRPVQDAAPNTVPDEVIPMQAATNVPGDATGPSTGPGTIGVPEGVDGSVGDLNSIPIVASAPPVEEKIYQPYEVKAPVLLRKIDPIYPNAFVRAAMQATVVVRCVIDKNGQVHSPEVLTSGMKPFDDAVIAAVQQWRYTPASLRGVAVDSYLDVTVRFTVRR